ncbi:hypothetical protein HanOQP8_Chr04g0156861 [Helianthus annuus]|nr:hypothetical protein HanHA89_Chr04g0157981 [Helianthus annuus]KAJ0758372.1 hypothetical protein HanLR1_Chr04g0149671 [Helianthus annuus]KAJ0762031.1 hypothetical protein HanOQP8_Chr04g0156861 [Helianthus annuus]
MGRYRRFGKTMGVVLGKSGVSIVDSLKVEVGNGKKKVRFWSNKWLGSEAFKNIFPEVYKHAKDKKVQVEGCY